MSDPAFTGHCYCGAVTFEISGKSNWVGHCHCESCRRHSGSAMTTFAGFDEEQVKFTGAAPRQHHSGDGVTRSFCGQCGSPVAYQADFQPGRIHLQLGLFDDIESLPADDHSFRNEKSSWLRADEHLPKSDWQG